MAWGSLLFKIEKQKDLVGEGKHNNNLFKYSDSLKPFALNKALIVWFLDDFHFNCKML